MREKPRPAVGALRARWAGLVWFPRCVIYLADCQCRWRRGRSAIMALRVGLLSFLLGSFVVGCGTDEAPPPPEDGCQDVCVLDARRCQDDTLDECQSDDDGCLGWVSVGPCAPEPAPRCETPPADGCVNDRTFRQYAATGTVTESGVCEYGYEDRSCPNCPSCDLCADVRCETPASVCEASVGRCEEGQCVYDPLSDGSQCDDGDPCTDGDACSDGQCGGTPRVCDEPPPPVCLSENRVRRYSPMGTCGADGRCAYELIEELCSEGCDQGFCKISVGCQTGPISGFPASTIHRVFVSGGDLHVVSANAMGLTVARRTQDGFGNWVWTHAIVEGPDTGGGVAEAAHDGAGNTHLLYVVRSGADGRPSLYYAAGSVGAGFSPMRLADYGRSPAVATNRWGDVHIAYHDGNQIVYRTLPIGGTWSAVEVVREAVGVVEDGLEIAVAGSDVHIVMGTSGGLVHSARGAAGWSSQSVRNLGRVGQVDVAVDGTTMHVAYTMGRLADELHYARYQSARWTNFDVPSPASSLDPQVVVDSGARVQVSRIATSNSGFALDRYRDVRGGALSGPSAAIAFSGVVVDHEVAAGPSRDLYYLYVENGDLMGRRFCGP